MPIKPILQALLLAERVYFDRDTNKAIIAGTFDSLAPPRVPSEYQAASVAFLSLTEIHGKVDISLRFVDLANHEVLMDYGPLPISCLSPLDGVEFHVPIPSLPMPHEGAFALEVYADNELIGSHRVTVSIATSEENLP